MDTQALHRVGISSSNVKAKKEEVALGCKKKKTIFCVPSELCNNINCENLFSAFGKSTAKSVVNCQHHLAYSNS